jgi:hypothetical protein
MLHELIAQSIIPAATYRLKDTSSYRWQPNMAAGGRALKEFTMKVRLAMK